MPEVTFESFLYLAEFHCEAGEGGPVPPSLRTSFCRNSEESLIGWGFHFPDRDALPRGYLESVHQRRELLARIDWPEIHVPVVLGGGSGRGFALHCPPSEGELLLSYLERLDGIPEGAAIRMMMEVLGFVLPLAEIPRVLSCVELEDFRVSGRDGILPGVQFCPAYPLLREERPLSDFQIAQKWAESMARLHAFVKRNGKVGFTEISPGENRTFCRLLGDIDMERERSLTDRIRDIVRLLENELDQAADEQARFEFSSTRRRMPVGPLAQHLRDGFARALPGNIPPTVRDDSDSSPCFSPFVVEVSSDGGTVDRLGYLLPPEQWFETSLVDPVHRRLSHPFLKTHPNCVRVRSVYCDDQFTILLGDISPGLPLPVLLNHFDGVTRAELLLISGKLHRALEQFESACFDFPLLSPWQVEIHPESKQSMNSWMPFLHGEISSWPSWDVKLRVEKPAESCLIDESGAAWQFVLKRLQGKFFPALMSWMLDWKRFQWAARRGSLEDEPLHGDIRLDALFKAAAEHLDVANTGHRGKFYSLITEGLEAHTGE